MNNKKIEKKKRKLIDRINEMETELRNSLTKKSSDTAEISVGDYQRKIIELKKQLKSYETN